MPASTERPTSLPRPRTRLRTGASLIAVAAALSGGAVAATAAPSPAPSPAPAMPTAPADATPPLHGAAAVKYLEATGTAAAVASDVSMTATELTDELQHDPLMFLSTDGLVGYSEPVVPAGADVGADVVASPAVPVGVDVFALASRPSTTKVIYLDFTGHTTSGTQWNSDYGIEPIVSAPFDLDGDSSTFTDSERSRIYDIWTRVADDYAPFDVNVTTVDPGDAGIVKSSGGDHAYGTRVVISGTDWFTTSQGFAIGGIAYIDIFGTAIGYPAFVFTENLGHGDAKNVAEAASHEAGHTFGLLHDGTTSVSYYQGHGDWAPIMGVGYYRTITQWSKGEYTAANNTEDDVATIVADVGEVADDHGDTAGTATTVDASSTTAGVIAVSDVDQFTVTVGAGTLTATVAPSGLGLHARVSIIDGSGTTLAQASPATATGFTVTATTTVTAGSYRVEVRPVGWLTAATGFTTYASMGAYSLTVAGPAVDATTTTTTTTTLAPTTTTTLAPTTTTTTTAAPTTTLAPTTTTTTTTAVPTTTAAPTTTTTTTTTTTAVPTTTVAPTTTTPPPSAPDPRAGFTPMTPTRLVDTRTRLGGSGRLGARGVVAVQITGRNGIPSGATAAVVNVTAVLPAGAGRLAVVPCTSGTPTTSVVSYAAGQVVATTTIATLDARGRLCVWTSTAADVIVDVAGWLTPGTGARLATLGPVRIADTRTGLGGTTRLPADRTLVLDVTARAANASAVALNVTAVGADAPGYLTVYPCGRARPTASTLNYVAGEARPNHAIVGVGGGKVCIYTRSTTDILVDLVGAFGATGLRYVPTAPRRLVDTRTLGPRLAAGASVEYSVGTNSVGRPAAAQITITALDHLAAGFVSTYACGTLPPTSTLNVTVGQSVSNGAIARATARSTSCAFTRNGGHLLIDVTGWWV